MEDVTDQALFDAATSHEPTQELPAEAIQPEAVTEQAQPRDDAGRFAAKAEDQPNEPGAQPDKSEAFVPSARLREEAEARRRADARIAELERLLTQQVQPKQPDQQQPAATDIWEDPDKYIDTRLGTVKTEVQQVREFYSRRLAEEKHGSDKVSAAYQALDTAIRSGQVNGEAVKAELAKSMDPYGEIMTWHARHSIMSEIGSDPEAYKQKIIEEYKASQQQPAPNGQTTTQQAAPVLRIPQSLNRQTSAASNAASAGGEDVSDAALFSSTVARRR